MRAATDGPAAKIKMEKPGTRVVIKAGNQEMAKVKIKNIASG